ncbi:MAG: sn-glycerol-3-phosphate ABC transporter ATP-binding protein UgpC [Granulosicoccus sp.]
MAFLIIDSLNKSFAKTEVLKNITLEIEEGGFLVLVGPSGCGKSTLLNMIAGLEPVSSGEIRINGRNVTDLHPSRRDIAMVFQSYALYPNMTVAGNIGFGMEIRGVGKEERNKAIADVADTLQIGHLLKRRPAQLSGGQRQRVAMGRALVRKPLVFLFDEPLSNLDARLRVDMRMEIKKLHQNLGTTIVYVTHDQIEAMTLATQIAVLKDGEIQQVGSPNDIYNLPANTFVADFMGSPAMNRIAGTIESTSGGGIAFLFDGCSLPVVNGSSALQQRIGAAVEFGIRAEDVTDASSADSRSTGLQLLHRTTDVIEPTGSDTFVATLDGGVRMMARVRNNSKLKPGDVLELTFNMEKAHFFDADNGQRIE